MLRAYSPNQKQNLQRRITTSCVGLFKHSFQNLSTHHPPSLFSPPLHQLEGSYQGCNCFLLNCRGSGTRYGSSPAAHRGDGCCDIVLVPRMPLPALVAKLHVMATKNHRVSACHGYTARHGNHQRQDECVLWLHCTPLQPPSYQPHGECTPWLHARLGHQPSGECTLWLHARLGNQLSDDMTKSISLVYGSVIIMNFVLMKYFSHYFIGIRQGASNRIRCTQKKTAGPSEIHTCMYISHMTRTIIKR